MTVQEQQYEGEFRFVNSRLITNSEEIAFYQGNKPEQRTINKTFKKLVNLFDLYFYVGHSDLQTYSGSIQSGHVNHT